MSNQDRITFPENLLRCPFCGSRASCQPWHGGAPTKVMIGCAADVDDVACEVSPMVTGETLEEAVTLWNHRRNDGWRDINEQAMSGERMLLLWMPSSGFKEHVELGRFCKAKKVWVNTYDLAFHGAPDKWAPLAPSVISEGNQNLLERLQAIIDWCDLAMKNRKEFDSHGVRLLDGPVFDAAREVLSAYGQGGAA